jgi:hypothetical protein
MWRINIDRVDGSNGRKQSDSCSKVAPLDHYFKLLRKGEVMYEGFAKDRNNAPLTEFGKKQGCDEIKYMGV